MLAERQPTPKQQMEAAMRSFRKRISSTLEPCTWNYLVDKLHDAISASIVCPNGHYGILTDHKIDDEGVVSPSVVCPIAGCNFHDYVVLKGWDPALVKQKLEERK